MKHRLALKICLLILLQGIFFSATLFPLWNYSKNCGASCDNYSIGYLYAGENSAGAEPENAGLMEGPCDNQKDVLYKIMFITLTIWIGISVYLFLTNRKVASLEKKLDEL